MIKKLIRFKAVLLLLLALCYGLHYFFIKELIDPVLFKMFQLSYLGNFIITSIVYFALILLNQKQAKKRPKRSHRQAIHSHTQASLYPPVGGFLELVFLGLIVIYY